ncbi:hypothetical protein [Streptomyces sp. NPDC001833]|uniref:hypothetical protein n=1 Tax=Streptomyces sp. NPDC001833 TaxID=3154658 RepID=UPI00331E7E39
MSAQTLPTAPHPPTDPAPARLPRPGTYTAGDRCIIELTTRLGPLVTMRCRLTADEAALTVAPSASDTVLSLKLTGVALGGDELTFVSTAVEPKPEADDARLRIPGALATGDPTASSIPATLTLRVVDRTDDSLLVLGTVQVPYGHLRRATGLVLSRIRPADRLRLLVAAEFTCPA